jgi:hypothetical protein
VSATAATKRLVDLTDEELADLLGLVGGADSVELKLTVPDVDHRATVSALGIDPLDSQIRQIFFFDTPDLALNTAGVVARARRIQGKTHDSVIKLRPVAPDALSADLRQSAGLTVEVDAMPGGYICSASLKREVGRNAVADAVAGEMPLRKLFSKQQRTFLADHAPEGVKLEQLAVLGPIFVLKLKFSPDGYGRKLVAEMWLYPDGARILELSTKCAPSEIFQVALEARSYLAGVGVNLSGEQQTKTKTALEFFSSDLGLPEGGVSRKERS